MLPAMGWVIAAGGLTGCQFHVVALAFVTSCNAFLFCLAQAAERAQAYAAAAQCSATVLAAQWGAGSAQEQAPSPPARRAAEFDSRAAGSSCASGPPSSTAEPPAAVAPGGNVGAAAPAAPAADARDGGDSASSAEAGGGTAAAEADVGISCRPTAAAGHAAAAPLYDVEALQLWLLQCCQVVSSFSYLHAASVLRAVLTMTFLRCALQRRPSEPKPNHELNSQIALIPRVHVPNPAQIKGGLRDKPGKPVDYYHSCYCLSGLSAAQHYSGVVVGPPDNLLAHADPLCNVVAPRLEAARRFYGAAGA